MKRIVLLFTVAAMMAMMALVMGAGPALALDDLDDNGDLNVFSIFDEEEDEDVDVRFIDVDEDEDVDCDDFDDQVICFIEEDDDDDDDDDGLIDALFGDDDDDDHWFGRDHWDHWR